MDHSKSANGDFDPNVSDRISGDEDEHNTDEDGVRFAFLEGFQPQRSNKLGFLEDSQSQRSDGLARTPWMSLSSTDVVKPDWKLNDPLRGFWLLYGKSDVKLYERNVWGYCAAQLIRPELMHRRAPDFRMTVITSENTTGDALAQLFDLNRGQLKAQYRHQGIWGSDSTNSWILVIERLKVDITARRQGWGYKLLARMLDEIVRRARAAHKTVIVLTLPTPPANEVRNGTISEGQGVRRAQAFCRSMGFVRLRETPFFGWTRNVSNSLVSKSTVSPEDLARDAEIDRKRYKIRH